MIAQYYVVAVVGVDITMSVLLGIDFWHKIYSPFLLINRNGNNVPNMGYCVGPCSLLTSLAISAFLLSADRRKRTAMMNRAAPSRSVTASMVTGAWDETKQKIPCIF